MNIINLHLNQLQIYKKILTLNNCRNQCLTWTQKDEFLFVVKMQRNDVTNFCFRIIYCCLKILPLSNRSETVVNLRAAITCER